MTVNQNDSSEADSSADALSKYATMTEAINKAITEYQQALSNYEAQMAVYADQKKKWDEAVSYTHLNINWVRPYLDFLK